MIERNMLLHRVSLAHLHWTLGQSGPDISINTDSSSHESAKPQIPPQLSRCPEYASASIETEQPCAMSSHITAPVYEGIRSESSCVPRLCPSPRSHRSP
jgi:hypothetical protein